MNRCARLLDVPPGAGDSPLAVLTTFFTTVAYRRPLQNFHRFAQGVADAGVPLFCIECAVPGRPFLLPERPGLMRVVAEHPGWHKERLLNILERAIPPRFQQLAWIDADVLFDTPDWAWNTVAALRNAPVVQMFERAQWLDPHGAAVMTWPGVAVENGALAVPVQGLTAHPGFAWAMHRDVWRSCRGLLDRFGSMGADSVMGCAWMGQRYSSDDVARVPSVAAWVTRAGAVTRGVVGAVPGTVRHLWHGEYSNRQYGVLWERLRCHGWNPDADLIDSPVCPLMRPYLLARPEVFVPLYQEFFQQRREDG